MTKERMKQELIEGQGGVCAETSKPLPEDLALTDTHRLQPKASGGTYDDLGNVVVSLPVAHMQKHGTLREREEVMENLKEAMDERAQVIKAFNKINNQLLAHKRRVDHLNQNTVDFLTGLMDPIVPERKRLDKLVVGLVKEVEGLTPLVRVALGVRAVGPITVAACLVYIDLEKARHASSVWKYAGLHAASHKRYTKGKASGGNKTLRTYLYSMAESQVKQHGPYRAIYDQVKGRLSKSENMVESRNTEGNLIECAWRDTKPSHRHGAALRAVMKHFLADYWYVGRTLAGLDTTPIYAEAMLGGTHRTIMPEERGWVY
jgi:hypothetical protein